MLLTNNNHPLTLYHGTNRKFTNHDLNKSRTELNDRFQGDWICYTPSEDVAWKYAEAARNQCIDKDAFFEETEQYLDRNFPDEQLNQFLINSFEILMNDAFEQAWNTIGKRYSEQFEVPEDEALKHFFNRLDAYKELDSGFDLNDFYDVLDYVEYSKSGIPDETNEIMNIFSQKIDEIPFYVLEFLESKNYEKSLPEPKVIKSHIWASNVLETEDRDEAKNAKKNGYDLVIYSGPDCVDDVPEYLIADTSQIEMQSMTLAHKSVQYVDENKTEWIENIAYEDIDLKEKPSNSNKKRMRP